MTNRDLKRITAKASMKFEKEMRKEVRSLIRTLKADIKIAAKKGVSDFRCKIRNADVYEKAKSYFAGKGFRCYEYISENNEYLAIEW